MEEEIKKEMEEEKAKIERLLDQIKIHQERIVGCESKLRQLAIINETESRLRAMVAAFKRGQPIEAAAAAAAAGPPLIETIDFEKPHTERRGNRKKPYTFSDPITARTMYTGRSLLLIDVVSGKVCGAAYTAGSPPGTQMFWQNVYNYSGEIRVRQTTEELAVDGQFIKRVLVVMEDNTREVRNLFVPPSYGSREGRELREGRKADWREDRLGDREAREGRDKRRRYYD